MWWFFKGLFSKKYSDKHMNVSNPISYYKDYRSLDFVGNVCEKCRCLMPIHGQVGYNVLFDKEMLDKSIFKFTSEKTMLSTSRWKDRIRKRKEHRKIFPQELTGYFYTVNCRKCRYKYYIKEVVNQYYHEPLIHS